MPDAAPRALPAMQRCSDGVCTLILGDDPTDGTGQWIACAASHVVSGSDAQ